MHWYLSLNLLIMTIPAMATWICFPNTWNQAVCFPSKRESSLSDLYCMCICWSEQLSMSNGCIRESAETQLKNKLLTKLYLRFSDNDMVVACVQQWLCAFKHIFTATSYTVFPVSVKAWALTECPLPSENILQISMLFVGMVLNFLPSCFQIFLLKNEIAFVKNQSPYMYLFKSQYYIKNVKKYIMSNNVDDY